jgi:hypothetical protein
MLQRNFICEGKRRGKTKVDRAWKARDDKRRKKGKDREWKSRTPRSKRTMESLSRASVDIEDQSWSSPLFCIVLNFTRELALSDPTRQKTGIAVQTARLLN